jgi:hypothetical protein
MATEDQEELKRLERKIESFIEIVIEKFMEQSEEIEELRARIRKLESR